MAAPVLAAAAMNPKTIKTIVIIVVVIVVLYFAYQAYKKYQERKEAEKLVGNSDALIAAGKPTLTAFQYKAMADKIFAALDATISNETAVLEVVNQLNTKADFASLVKAFGVREKGVMFNKTPMNLIQWLQDELSSSNLKAVNQALQRLGVQV
jgi:predicted negative regulator of RcsB-dependent stress response